MLKLFYSFRCVLLLLTIWWISEYVITDIRNLYSLGVSEDHTSYKKYKMRPRKKRKRYHHLETFLSATRLFLRSSLSFCVCPTEYGYNHSALRYKICLS